MLLATFSAIPSTSTSGFTTTSDFGNYITGIALLSLALFFAGFLGLVQDWTYSTYGQPQPSTNEALARSDSQVPQWQESLFYLHFLSLPMFIFLRQDIETQARLVSNGPRAAWSAKFPVPSTVNPFLVLQDVTPVAPSQAWSRDRFLHFSFPIPHALIPLLLNIITQLVCASGVHRLTTRVSSLTVTLILVVRKAVSLLLSVLGADTIPGVDGRKARTVDHRVMWGGATFVLIGTILYCVGTKSGGHVAAVKEGKQDWRERLLLLSDAYLWFICIIDTMATFPPE